MRTQANIYIPARAEIERVSSLSHDVKLFTLKTGEKYRPGAGQFFMVSTMGSGEVPISVASAPGEELSLCIRKVGQVTSAIHRLKKGDELGIRGPYGNGFSLKPARGKAVILIAGGMGIAPLRPLIREIAANRKSYGDVFVLYGAKTPSAIIFKGETAEWEKSASVLLTVDKPDRKWKGHKGVVTKLLDGVKIDFSKASAFVCGPEVMMRASLEELSSRGVPDESIVTTLEAHMKCGVGKCGHCYMGSKFLCTDGPVFSLKEIKEIRQGSPGPS